MAEPFGIATGVLQVAGIGAELGSALWKCSNDIPHAHRDIGEIAAEVRHTSNVVGSIGSLLAQQDASEKSGTATFTDEARSCLRDRLKDCQSAFFQLDEALRSARQPLGYRKLAISGRWKWPLSKATTVALQGKLKGLTALLSLMLQVLDLARKTEEW